MAGLIEIGYKPGAVLIKHLSTTPLASEPTELTPQEARDLARLLLKNAAAAVIAKARTMA
jgi:hypothetical protein